MGIDGLLVIEEAFGVGDGGVGEDEGGAGVAVDFRVDAIDLGGLFRDLDIDVGGFRGGGAEGAPHVLGGDFGKLLLVVGFGGEFLVDGVADGLEGFGVFVAEEDGGVVFEGVFGIEVGRKLLISQ